MAGAGSEEHNGEDLVLDCIGWFIHMTMFPPPCFLQYVLLTDGMILHA